MKCFKKLDQIILKDKETRLRQRVLGLEKLPPRRELPGWALCKGTYYGFVVELYTLAKREALLQVGDWNELKV